MRVHYKVDHAAVPTVTLTIRREQRLLAGTILWTIIVTIDPTLLPVREGGG
jgi:hypothetical protein